MSLDFNNEIKFVEGPLLFYLFIYKITLKSPPCDMSYIVK
jgi:hypothetical protein